MTDAFEFQRSADDGEGVDHDVPIYSDGPPGRTVAQLIQRLDLAGRDFKDFLDAVREDCGPGASDWIDCIG